MPVRINTTNQSTSKMRQITLTFSFCYPWGVTDTYGPTLIAATRVGTESRVK